jgi:CheY-like chemotaxis protein
MKLQNKIPLPASEDRMPQAEAGGRTRVLLAEDDRALRRYLEVVLERAGYQVIPASDGLEAMKIVVSTPIDVVITDSMMPNLNGHEFCRFLRSSQKLSQLPIILLSALERKEANQNVEQADAFLSKPVSGESLIECIEKLLARQKVMSDE